MLPSTLTKSLSKCFETGRGIINYDQIFKIAQNHFQQKQTFDVSQKVQVYSQQLAKLQQDTQVLQRSLMECQQDRQEYFQKFNVEQERNKSMQLSISKQLEEIHNLKMDLEIATKIQSEMQSKINQQASPKRSSSSFTSVLDNPKQELKNVSGLQKQLKVLEEQFYKLQLENESILKNYDNLKSELELKRIAESKLKKQLDARDEQIVKQDIEILHVQTELQQSLLKTKIEDKHESNVLDTQVQEHYAIPTTMPIVETSDSPKVKSPQPKFFKTPSRVVEEPKETMSVTSPIKKQFMVVVSADNLAQDIYDIQDEIKSLNINHNTLQLQIRDIVNVTTKYLSDSGFDEVFQLLGYSVQDIKDFRGEQTSIQEYEYQAKQNILGLWDNSVEKKITDFLDKKLRQVELTWPGNFEVTNQNRISVKLSSSLFLALVLGFQTQWKQGQLFPDLYDADPHGSGILIKGW